MLVDGMCLCAEDEGIWQEASCLLLLGCAHEILICAGVHSNQVTL